jgi:hypothetical protein
MYNFKEEGSKKPSKIVLRNYLENSSFSFSVNVDFYILKLSKITGFKFYLMKNLSYMVLKKTERLNGKNSNITLTVFFTEVNLCAMSKSLSMELDNMSDSAERHSIICLEYIRKF